MDYDSQVVPPEPDASAAQSLPAPTAQMPSHATIPEALITLSAEQFQQLLGARRPETRPQLSLKDYRIEDFPGERSARLVTSWINRMERALHLLGSTMPEGLDEKTAIAIASFNLTNKAQVWWDTLPEAIRPLSWEEFKESIKLEFIPTNNAQRVRERLHVLRQTGSVAKYLAVFSDLFLELGEEVSEADKLD